MKVPNQITELRFLIENKYDWITCLIHGHTVEIYGANIGLDTNRDFEDFEKWFNEDYSYIELSGEELLDLYPHVNYILMES